MGSTSAQGSVGNGLAGDNLGQHQARLQAAAAAASIYEKSYVYPSANTLVWYAPLCYVYNHLVCVVCVQGGGRLLALLNYKYGNPRTLFCLHILLLCDGLRNDASYSNST